MARPRSEEVQQKVLAAGVDLIAEVGVSGFTIDAVASRSGVAKTTIYRRWSSTGELLMATLDCSIKHLATPNNGNLRDDLLELYAAVLDMMNEPQMFGTMIGAIARAANDAEFRRLLRELEIERHQPLRTILQLAQGRGEIAPDANLDLMMDIVEGPIAARKFMRLETFKPQELEAVVDMLLSGILVR